MIYKKHLNDADVPQATKKAVTWIKDKILHGYYMTGMEDRYSSFLLKLYLGCIVLLTTESLYRMLTKYQFKLYQHARNCMEVSFAGIITFVPFLFIPECIQLDEQDPT